MDKGCFTKVRLLKKKGRKIVKKVTNIYKPKWKNKKFTAT